MKDVDWGESDENELLAAANDEVAVSVDANDGFEVASDCDALADGGREDEAAADGKFPVLKGTVFWRYRRRPSMSRPAERFVKTEDRSRVHRPIYRIILKRSQLG